MSNFRQSESFLGMRPAIRSLALRLPEGCVVEPHHHPWSQVVFAVRGSIVVEAENRQWTLPPNRCLFVPSGVPHQLWMMNETWIRTIYLHPKLKNGLPSGIRVLETTPLLRELIIEAVQLGSLDFCNKEQRCLGTMLLLHLTRARGVELSLPLPKDRRALEVARRALVQLGGRSSLAGLVRGAGVSVRTAERIFQKETGMSFGRWRRQARLQRAVRLLAEGASASEAAFRCGYESVSAFVVMFKRSLGTTPGKYFAIEKDPLDQG